MLVSDDLCNSPVAHSQPSLRQPIGPYSYSVASSASASATSVWSSASDSSQSSEDASDYSCASTQTSVSNSSNDSACLSQQFLASCQFSTAVPQQQQHQHHQQTVLPPQLRQNPRRTGAAPASVPSIVRQSERRSNFVDHLVDASTQIVQAIWPLSSVVGRGENGAAAGHGNGSYLLPLRTFIQETLRRSRASYSTLQVALYYLLLIKPRLPRHNFTMEQPSDNHGCRALQCGRRMFLAALILASKYLQDRNYSARAWSKISGLSTAEINQNETAFLHAVNWRLHITNDVYVRWMQCVNKFNPPQLPPSPGPAAVECFERKCEEFRLLIWKLTPSLDNLDDLFAPSMAVGRRSSCQPSSLSSSDTTLLANEGAAVAKAASSALPRILPCSIPSIVEPSAAPAPPAAMPLRRSLTRMASMSSLHLTAPASAVVASAASAASSTYCTPAAGVCGQLLAGNRSSMSFAVAQASNVCASQAVDRWTASLSSSSASSTLPTLPSLSALPALSTSPIGYTPTRRSSLAMSVSTASSPESMVSDSSLVSRASSVSSAWSAMSAPSGLLSKPDTQARRHLTRQSSCGSGICDKGIVLRPMAISVVHEDYDETSESVIFASPETIYTGPVGSKDVTGTAQLSLDGHEDDGTGAAARALAELQQQFTGVTTQQQQQQQRENATPRRSLKRSRPLSVEQSYLQDNVRDILRTSYLKGETNGRSNNTTTGVDMQVAARAAMLTGSRKRLCRTLSTMPAPVAGPLPYYMDLQHPSMVGLCGPGMWQGILD